MNNKVGAVMLVALFLLGAAIISNTSPVSRVEDRGFIYSLFLGSQNAILLGPEGEIGGECKPTSASFTETVDTNGDQIAGDPVVSKIYNRITLGAFPSEETVKADMQSLCEEKCSTATASSTLLSTVEGIEETCGATCEALGGEDEVCTLSGDPTGITCSAQANEPALKAEWSTSKVYESSCELTFSFTCPCELDEGEGGAIDVEEPDTPEYDTDSSCGLTTSPFGAMIFNPSINGITTCCAYDWQCPVGEYCYYNKDSQFSLCSQTFGGVCGFCASGKAIDSASSTPPSTIKNEQNVPSTTSPIVTSQSTLCVSLEMYAQENNQCPMDPSTGTRYTVVGSCRLPDGSYGVSCD